MDTLYRFKLDTETGLIDVSEIKDYNIKKDSRFTYYQYRGKSCTNWVKSKNIDKMFCNQVYTFNPDKEHAIKIMFDGLTDKINNALSIYKKADKLRDNLIHNYLNDTY